MCERVCRVNSVLLDPSLPDSVKVGIMVIHHAGDLGCAESLAKSSGLPVSDLRESCVVWIERVGGMGDADDEILGSSVNDVGGWVRG